MEGLVQIHDKNIATIIWGAVVIISLLWFVLWGWPSWKLRSIERDKTIEVAQMRNELRKSFMQVFGGFLALATLAATVYQIFEDREQFRKQLENNQNQFAKQMEETRKQREQDQGQFRKQLQENQKQFNAQMETQRQQRKQDQLHFQAQMDSNRIQREQDQNRFVEQLKDNRQQRQQAQEQFREKLATEHYIQAVQLLNDTNLTIRQGGLYSLERIGKTSPTDKPTIRELLSSYIRGKRPYNSTKNIVDADVLAGIEILTRTFSDSVSIENPIQQMVPILILAYQDSTIRDSLNDIFSAKFEEPILETLSRKKPNLARLGLESVYSTKIKLRGLNLQNANLKKAYFLESDFSFTILANARLTSATLPNGNFYRTNLYASHLPNATLRGANLQESILLRTKLDSADLSSADLRGALLGLTHLDSADLSGANFSDAFLSKVKLRNSQLYGANFKGAYLRKVDFRRANFYKTTLQEAYLIEADMREAINLTVEQLVQARSLYKTQLPPELETQLKQLYPQDHKRLRKESMESVLISWLQAREKTAALPAK